MRRVICSSSTRQAHLSLMSALCMAQRMHPAKSPKKKVVKTKKPVGGASVDQQPLRGASAIGDSSTNDAQEESTQHSKWKTMSSAYADDLEQPASEPEGAGVTQRSTYTAAGAAGSRTEADAEQPLNMQMDELPIFATGKGNNDDHSEEKGEPKAAAAPWSFEKVDESYHTDLEAAYERSKQKILRLFAEPLIIDIPTTDGNYCPDVFVGFRQYDHRRRDEYRQAIALTCDVSPKSVSLSTAWSGRFDPARFPHSRKVLGVTFAPSTSTSQQEIRAQTLVEAVRNNKLLERFSMNAASAATEEVVIQPGDLRVEALAGHIAAEALAHRIYVVYFSEEARLGMERVLWNRLTEAKVVAKYAAVADHLRACSMDPSLEVSPAGEQTESLRVLDASLRRLSGGQSVDLTAVVFINGALLGGPRETKEFLRRNAKVLVASLQRPTDISFKETFIGKSKKTPRPVVQRDSSLPTAR